MTNLLLLFVAGGLGTLSRHGLNVLARDLSRRFEFLDGVPFGTAVINGIGCLLFGVILGLVDREILPRDWGPLLLVGFLGAFTTFSTFAAEAQLLAKNARWFEFWLYLGMQNGVGILAVALGMRLTR